MRHLFLSCFFALFGLLTATSSQAAKILVVDMKGSNGVNFTAIPSNLATELAALGHTPSQWVTSASNPPPTVLQPLRVDPVHGYDQVWVFGNTASAAQFTAMTTTLVNYLNQGGAVYVQSEVICCDTVAKLAEDLIRAAIKPELLKVGSENFTHDSAQIVLGFQPAIFNPDLDPAALTCTPPVTFTFRSVRIFSNVNMKNRLIVLENTQGAGLVGFKKSDMISGKGTLLSLGDINVLAKGNGDLLTNTVLLQYMADTLTNISSGPTGDFCPLPTPSKTNTISTIPSLSGVGLLLLGLLLPILSFIMPNGRTNPRLKP